MQIVGPKRRCSALRANQQWPPLPPLQLLMLLAKVKEKAPLRKEKVPEKAGVEESGLDSLGRKNMTKSTSTATGMGPSGPRSRRTGTTSGSRINIANGGRVKNYTFVFSRAAATAVRETPRQFFYENISTIHNITTSGSSLYLQSLSRSSSNQNNISISFLTNANDDYKFIIPAAV